MRFLWLLALIVLIRATPSLANQTQRRSDGC